MKRIEFSCACRAETTPIALELPDEWPEWSYLRGLFAFVRDCWTGQHTGAACKHQILMINVQPEASDLT